MEKKIKLSENLNELMKKRGISLSVTAKKVGMNKGTLSNYCSGIEPRNLLSITRLADFFGVTMGELIFGYDQSGLDQKGSPIVGRYELIIRPVEDELTSGSGNSK